jgi:hypothetical protein
MRVEEYGEGGRLLVLLSPPICPTEPGGGGARK